MACNLQNDFAASQLYVTQYTDEDGNQSREYKDKLGRVVCKASHDGTNWLETHYVYDDFGLLHCVVPPKATNPNTDTELCYYYQYDGRKRMIMKDFPGADPVYMVYDKRDRLVMVQDGNLAADGKWQFTKYDGLNRPVMTGIFSISKTQLQAAADFENDTGSLYESRGTSLFGYTKTSFPDAYDVLIGEGNVNSVTWYDDYSFPGSAGYSFGNFSLAGYTVPQSAKIKGMVTGTLTRVLVKNDAVAKNLLLSVSYYDDFGRPTRIISDNHLGGKDVVFTNYNFSGQVTQTTTVHNHGQGSQVMLATTYAYDHQGRMTIEKLKINQQNEITLAAYKYNKLGEQVARYLHGSSSGNDFNQQVDYTYNEKGWMRRMNTVSNLGRDLFALDLRYNTPGSSDALTAGARYNGNISEMRWDAGTPKGYGFAYDELNRLTAADYAEGSSFTGNADYYNTSYTYDKNGNIDLLNRYRGTKIDGLDYTYGSNDKSNQLLSVTDGGTTAGYRAAGGSYLYDANGNLTNDPSKGTTIEYNPLNLPEKVSFGANDNLRYTYDAAGNKLIKVVDGINAENNTRIDYSANFLYENNDLKTIFTSAGRIVPFNNNGEVLYKYEYNLQDHLGNTRVVFSGHNNGMPEVMQVTDYYPFGLVMNQQNYFADGVLDNKYLYNGKELQDDELAGNSLGWYDYGARFYDAELGRWHVADVLGEFRLYESPYCYVGNNPILRIDPDGRFWDVVLDVAFTLYDAAEIGYQYVTTGKIDPVSVAALSADALAIVIPGVTGAGIVTRVAAHSDDAVKVVKTTDKAFDAAKTANKATDGAKVVNGNSKVSTKAQHNYDIVDTQNNNKVVKAGTSGGKETKAGESYRGNSQANKWNRQEGTPGRYQSKTTNKVPEGDGARQKALDYEKNRANEVRDQLDPNKHKRP